MKTGDTVRDARGRTFQVGQLLGRGLWGRTYSARDEAAGSSWVLKVPHRASDLPDNDAVLAEACAEIALEQARLLEDGKCSALPRLECRLALHDGTPALVMPRANATLEQRLSGGGHLDELLGLLVEALSQLRDLKAIQPFHGNLKPTNILVSETGAVVIADPVTPAFRRVYPQLLAAARGAVQWCAPEVREATDTVPFGPPTDSYSLAMVLYRAAMSSPGHERFPELPMDGLDKARLVSLKDRVMNRLKKEHSNPRFHTRLSDRLAALLNRALSRQTSPSPPYRFRRLDEMQQRIGEIQAMVHPTISDVGRLILDQRPGARAFLTDAPVGLSCTVACTPGVEHHEEIACGLAIFDLDRDERLHLEDCSYSVDRHPSGRFRFGFRIGGLSPGGFRVRVAFTIRESGDEPITAEGEFRVRPAPGYVPPHHDPVPDPLPMERTGDPRSAGEARVTQPGVDAPRPAAVLSPAARPPTRPVARAAAPALPQPERVRDPASVSRRPVALRASTANEDTADPRSGGQPAPTPIAPFAPAERQQPHGRLAATAVAVSAEIEDFGDDLSAPIEDRLRLSPDRPSADRVIGRSPVPRSRPAPLPGGAPPGLRNRAPRRTSPVPASPSMPQAPQAAMHQRGHGPALAVRPIFDEDHSPVRDDAVTMPGVSTVQTRPEPAFRSVGRWTDLPLPLHDQDELSRGPEPDLPEVVIDHDTDDAVGVQGPVGALFARLLDTVRGDAYVMFISVAAAIILLLTILLVALKG